MITSTVASKSGEPASIGGYYLFVVASDSMEPTLNVNDIFIAKKGNNPEIGDIITYISPSGQMAGRLITHRVEEIKIENNAYIYYCRGDKTGAPLDIGITQEEIKAIYVCKVPVFSWVYRVLTNGFGFFFFIVAPLLFIFGSEIYKLIKNVKKERMDTLEIQKEKYIEQMKEQILNGLKENNKDNLK